MFSAQQLVFIHIPKTGGVSVRNLLTTVFPEKDIHPVPIGPHMNKRAFPYPATTEHLHESTRMFRGSEKKLIMGHYDMRIVQHLKNPFIFAMVRHPVNRVVSYYRFFSKPRQHLKFTQELAKMSFDDFLNDRTIQENQVQNAMSRFIDGVYWNENPTNPDPHRLLMKAQRINVLGLTERFGETIHLLESKANLHFRVQLPHINQSPTAPINLTESQTNRIIEMNAIDMQLYKMAKERFEHEYVQWCTERRTL